MRVVSIMGMVSFKKLTEIVTKLRAEKGYTQERLGNLTGISRIIIDRIERDDFVPSIVQLEELERVLEFDISEMFICKKETNSLHTFRTGTLNEVEEKVIEQILKMMSALRQQIMLKRKFELAEQTSYKEG